MLRRNVLQASPWHSRTVCLFCAARVQTQPSQIRSFTATRTRSKRARAGAKPDEEEKSLITYHESKSYEKKSPKTRLGDQKIAIRKLKTTPKPKKEHTEDKADEPKSLKEALLGDRGHKGSSTKKAKDSGEQLQIQELEAQDLTFEPVEVDIPPVPMLAYGLDRVLFNPGVYRLQDPRSRIFNFDPYLEKIMPVNEFDFEALSEYKTSSKDEALINLTKQLGTKFTGSTSSMSSVLQHFHFLLSGFRELNHTMLSRGFPDPSKKFSKITYGPDAIFLRYKEGIYAIDADKTYDSPNIMSWLGHSLEKLLTTERSEFELFRRSNMEQAPAEDNSSRCYHYSKQGNVLMRSQLDARDPRLPGSGVFDLKTRAVVSIRMNHKEYETGSGYQLRYDQGEWESFEREFYDMTRATMLKYSLQVRMGRMDGIFLAFHNIERIFGFQYLSIADMDRVLHGQEDTCLGNQEFKFSVALVDELLSRATTLFPETSIRLHFEARDAKTPFMYVFAEPVTEEQADEIQSRGEDAQKHFARTVVGVGKDNPEVQAAWQNIQDEVDEQVDEDKGENSVEEQVNEDNGNNLVDQQVQEDNGGSSAHEQAVGDRVDRSVEEDVEEDKVGESMEETPHEQDSEAEVDDVVEQASGSDSESQEPPSEDTDTSTTESKPSGPLMGWTLTVRNKVNGGYVDRPRNLQQEDEWKLEYHIQEIAEKSRWRLYEALRDRRRGLVGQEEQEVDKGLLNYRNLIDRFSRRGREWREKQDKLNEEMGVQLYRPLGPGSDAAESATDKTSGKAE